MVEFTLMSDPIQDQRYHANLRFPFPAKGATPTPGEVASLVGEAIRVDDASANSSPAEPQPVVASTPADESGCMRPVRASNFPDGASATKEQMIATRQQVQAYNSAINSYLDCLKRVISAADNSTKPRLIQINNQAVDELQSVATCFNSQLTAFKSTGGGGGGAIASCSIIEEASGSGAPLASAANAPQSPPAAAVPTETQTKTISIGQTRDQVIAVFGVPTKIVQLGKKEIDYFPDMKVTFVGNKVIDVN
jgi:hypothetical protein